MVETTLQTTQSIRLPIFSSYTKRFSFSVITGICIGTLFSLLFSLAPTTVAVSVGLFGMGVALLYNSFAQTRDTQTIWWSFLLGGQLLGAIGILLLWISL